MYPTGDVVKRVVQKGGCCISMYQDVLRQEWRNERRDKKQYFHTFAASPVASAGWATIKSSPYREIFVGKFTQMEEAGIISRLQSQYLVFKSMEEEELEPLKLEHFYITLIGIAVGSFLATMTFVVERLRRPNSIMLSKTKITKLPSNWHWLKLWLSKR